MSNVVPLIGGAGGSVVTAPAITISGTPPQATQGTSYSWTPTITNAQGNLRVQLDGGLPNGLSINSGTGEIRGTPVTEQTTTFSLTVRDDFGVASLSNVALGVIGGGLRILGNLPNAVIGSAYSFTPTIQGGTAPYTVAVSGLAQGLSANASTGTVNGTPTGSAGTLSLTFTVTDSKGVTATMTRSLVIAASVASLTISGTPSGAVVGGAGTFTPTVTGGTAPYTLSLLSGTLPPGRTVNGSAGTVTGTYTATGSYSYVLRVTDAAGATADLSVSVTVGASAVVMPFGDAGTKFDLDFAGDRYFGGTQPFNDNNDDGRFFRQQISQNTPMYAENADGSLAVYGFSGLRRSTRGIWVEPVRDHDQMKYARDLTNALWVKTGCTVARDLEGRDKAANSASRVTVTAANATLLQALTVAARTAQMWADIKSVSGTGILDMTTDGGATWTRINLNAPRYNGWGRYGCGLRSVADNPSVGFRFPNSGDVFGIDLVNMSQLAFEDSPTASSGTAQRRPYDRPSTALASNATASQSHGSGLVEFIRDNAVWGVYAEWASRIGINHNIFGGQLAVDGNGKVTFNTGSGKGVAISVGVVKPWPAINKAIGFSANGKGYICLNGEEPVEVIGDFGAYTELDHKDIMSNGAGTANGAGYVARLAILKTQPTVAQMKAWTASA